MKEYHINNIRCSYAAPCKQYQTKIINKEQYYTEGKEIFLNFVRILRENGRVFETDCNHIPICYFTNEEKRLLQSTCMNYDLLSSFFCESPALDIMPDMTGIACFGINQPIDLKQFKNIYEVNKYIRNEQIKSLRLKNQIGKCMECAQFDCLKCQGGCLSFVS